MRILVTGGTVFVSRCCAAWFSRRGHDVTVLNRGSRAQLPGVAHIRGDRLQAASLLAGMHFDAVIDATAYTGQDAAVLAEATRSAGAHLLISSSAVYPDTLPQPFREDMPTGPNRHWGAYGTGKIDAEQALLSCTDNVWIVRPPYLYGPWNEVYREAFIFECAMAGLPVFLPEEGQLPLQFFHIADLCRLLERILEERPAQHVLNCGNPEAITALEWVRLCASAAGTPVETRPIPPDVPVRSCFPFHPYAYELDVSLQQQLLPGLTPIDAGLQDCWHWWRGHRELIRRKPLMDFIRTHLLT